VTTAHGATILGFDVMPPAERVPAAPHTVTEALKILVDDGYVHDFDVRDGRVRCHACGEAHAADSAIVERFYRFEGFSNPDDEEIVFGLRCPVCGAKGTLVSAFGPGADPEELDALRMLDRHDR
jgi:hypothetical protein